MTFDETFIDMTDNQKESKSYFACVPLGIGKIFGAYTTGLISDKLGIKTGSFYVSFILVSVLVISLIMINS
jgi:hypothetical protein